MVLAMVLIMDRATATIGPLAPAPALPISIMTFPLGTPEHPPYSLHSTSPMKTCCTVISYTNQSKNSNPLFIAISLIGDQSNYQDLKSDYFRDRGRGNRDQMRPQRRSNLPGNMTPVGHRGSASDMRSHRRPYSQMDDYRYMRRNERMNDPQAFRRMIANEYRSYRPGTATENLGHYRHPHPNDDTRMKRIGTQSTADDRQAKNRRSSEKSTSQKRYPPSDLPERNRTGSRENLRRMRNFSQGPSPRASGAPGRFDPSGPHNNVDSRGAKRKAGEIVALTIYGW